MVKQIISKELAKELMSIKGEARGTSLKSHYEVILNQKGPKALKEIEDAMARLGYPVRNDEIESMGFYPIALEIIILLVIKELFNFSDKDFERLGASEAKYSFITRLFLRYFVSLKTLASQVSVMWDKYYTIGKLKVVKLDEKKRYAILRLEGFVLHPIHCLQLKGFLAEMTRMVVKEPVTCEEAKCPFKGDKYHEFFIGW